METEILIAHGNQAREDNNPDQALRYYASAFVHDRNNFNAFNNYGNVLREIGDPMGAIPFLQRAIQLNPSSPVARFNLAVSLLLLGDYHNGWPAYEVRWQYEHLAGTLPQLSKPRWTGQNLSGKKILIIGEQGHGDNIQFIRFTDQLQRQGAKILLQVTDGLVPLFKINTDFEYVGGYNETVPDFDYWVPIMSIPGVLGITLDNLPGSINYITSPTNLQSEWASKLGAKTKMRVGISWSGRRDTWLNRHKSVNFNSIIDLIKNNTEIEWINLQADATPEEINLLSEINVTMYPGTINTFADTASLMMNLDLIISVDTSISHLAGALGRPTWIMLNHYALDWRWLLNRDDSPWYPSAKLFRQPTMSDWTSVIKKIDYFLKLFKI